MRDSVRRLGRASQGQGRLAVRGLRYEHGAGDCRARLPTGHRLGRLATGPEPSGESAFAKAEIKIAQRRRHSEGKAKVSEAAPAEARIA